MLCRHDDLLCLARVGQAEFAVQQGELSSRKLRDPRRSLDPAAAADLERFDGERGA